MYLMSYFRTQAEALHLAISRDGLVWEALNENRPVLEDCWRSATHTRKAQRCVVSVMPDTAMIDH